MNAPKGTMWSKLHMLCLEDATELTPADLEKFIFYINASTENGSTPLHFVAVSGNLEMAWFLISNGADFVRNKAKETPLHWACQYGHVDLVDLFLNCGADINAVDEYDSTPLHWAAENNHDAIISLITSYSLCDINATNVNGFTALETACLCDAAESVDILIQKGVSTSRCIQICIEYGCPSVAKVLVNNGIFLTKLSDNFLTLAKKNNSFDIVKILFNISHIPCKTQAKRVVRKKIIVKKLERGISVVG